ncbi:MAG: AI-2E family transporter [Methyloceanibacter sp.]
MRRTSKSCCRISTSPSCSANSAPGTSRARAVCRSRRLSSLSWAIIGAVPMVLVAGGDSLNLALWVIGLYAVVQFTESYLLTPLIQARAVFLLPAVVILNQLVLAVLFGILGFALAPLAATVRTAS